MSKIFSRTLAAATAMAIVSSSVAFAKGDDHHKSGNATAHDHRKSDNVKVRDHRKPAKQGTGAAKSTTPKAPAPAKAQTQAPENQAASSKTNTTPAAGNVIVRDHRTPPEQEGNVIVRDHRQPTEQGGDVVVRDHRNPVEQGAGTATSTAATHAPAQTQTQAPAKPDNVTKNNGAIVTPPPTVVRDHRNDTWYQKQHEKNEAGIKTAEQNQQRTADLYNQANDAYNRAHVDVANHPNDPQYAANLKAATMAKNIAANRLQDANKQLSDAQNIFMNYEHSHQEELKHDANR